MSKRPSLYITCPKSGITYTVTDSYSVAHHHSQIHYNYTRLDSIIRKERWNAPSDYLVGAIFKALEDKKLIMKGSEETSAQLRGQLNYTLASAFPASKLYTLYTKLRDSSAGLKSQPIRLSFTEATTYTASYLYDLILSIAEQRLTTAEKELLFQDRKPAGNPSRTRITAKNAMDPEAITNRVSKSISPLMALVMEQLPEKAPQYYSSTLARKLATATKMHSGLSDTKRNQYRDLMAELFTLAITHSLIGVDDILYKSYFSFMSLIEKDLLKTNDDIWSVL